MTSRAACSTCSLTTLGEGLQVPGVRVAESALHRIQRLGDLVDVLADRQQLVIRAHERGHTVLQRGRVDGLHRRRALAEEVAKHEAKRCGAGAELALLLDLVQQGGQLGVEDEAAGGG